MSNIVRPEPGQVLATGEVAVPRQAATVILVRGGDHALEVLLVQRAATARILAGAWVFPGGTVDPEDGTGDDAVRAAAVRELAEEAAVAGVDPAGLVEFSRWITPNRVRSRYDTHFFLAALAEGAQPRVDGAECADLGWFTPGQALAEYAAGRVLLVFPTIKQLERLAGFATATELFADARSRRVEPVEPRMVTRDGEHHVLLPGDPGYDAA